MSIAEALALLELTTPFTEEEIKKAYRQTLMVWHPDRFSDAEMRSKANAKTQKIIQAF